MKAIKSLLAVTLLCFAMSVSSVLQAAETADWLDQKALEQYEGALRFRDIFRDVASKYGKSETDVQSLLFLPRPEALKTPPDALRARDSLQALEAITQYGRRNSAWSHYLNGRQTPFGAKGDTDQIFAATGPVTFIVVQGMLQETLDEDMFTEITELPSSFQQRYAAKLEGATDNTYDWSLLAEKKAPLSSLVKLGSIDDKDGHPLVQLIVLHSNFGSLETVGPLDRSSSIYLRRIVKVLDLLPAEATQNLFLLGFSRGTAISLDIVAKAHRQGYPQLSSLRGLVTLGGVVYGSDLADFPFRPFDAGFPEMTSPPDPLFLMDQAYKIASVLLKNAWDPISNVKRLAVLAGAVNEGVGELKTSSRVAWWKSHVLPANFPIYSINGSMPLQAMTLWPFNDSPFFGFGELDYGILRPMARKLQQGTGNYLNDGQITDVKGRLWTGLAEALNPDQPPLRVQSLGNVATHHYGLGARKCVKEVGGALNRFPRRIMMEALGAYVLERTPQ